jgi:hypothetical protein
LKIPKTPKTPKISEYGHATDNPDLPGYPINNSPCSQPSHDLSNDEIEALTAAIK